MVAIGKKLTKTLQEYIEKTRLKLQKYRKNETLILNDKGKPLTNCNLDNIVKQYRNLSGEHFTCHQFRHSYATHLLKNGGNIVYIKELLGHSSISTTERYTKVYPLDIKKIIDKQHPRNRERVMEEPILLPDKRSL